MRAKTLPIALFGLLPTMAMAGVVTNLPPVQGFSAPSTATAATTSSAANKSGTNQSADTADSSRVPAIAGGGSAPAGSAPAKAAPISPAQLFSQMTATPPQGPVSSRTKALEQQSLQASGNAIKSLPVRAGAAGSIRADANGRPVLVCAPLHTCVITLPNGSKPAITVGISKSEWNIQQAMVGKVPEIFLSPKFAGLHQNLVVAATLDGQTRNYQVRVVSDKSQYIPILNLQAENVSVRTWTSIGDSGTVPSVTKPKSPAVLPLPNVALDHINTDWRVSCGGGGWFRNSTCGPIKPLRVFDDGKRTYIEMPNGLASHGGYPILQAKNRSHQLIGVNTQIRGNMMVVDSVPHEIVLRLGKEVVHIQQGGGK